jgi:hypothetical protein
VGKLRGQQPEKSADLPPGLIFRCLRIWYATTREVKMAVRSFSLLFIAGTGPIPALEMGVVDIRPPSLL